MPNTQQILSESLEEIKTSIFDYGTACEESTDKEGRIKEGVVFDELVMSIITLANRLIESARAEGFKAGEEKGRNDAVDYIKQNCGESYDSEWGLNKGKFEIDEDELDAARITSNEITK
jgi:hypothetical protein